MVETYAYEMAKWVHTPKVGYSHILKLTGKAINLCV